MVLRQSTVRVWLACGVPIVAACIMASAAYAATLPSGFTERLVASGMSSPTSMQFAPDGRLFVCEQQGRLRVIKDGVLLPTPFLTLTVSSSGERGLLGVAFDPDFNTNRYVYVYYTATTPAVHNRISRFTANGDVALAGSEFVVFELDNLSSATNHNGGALAFGADGKLYAATGENGNTANSQSLNTVLGKILRINKDGSIPSDNPFYSSTAGKNRAIWALGLRNPFTFAFHPFDGRLFINDVGEGSWEEINEGIAGANYGWPDTEGPTSDPRFVSPRYAYNHSNGCAITGGAFYAPAIAQFPSEYVNDYFFADICGDWIKTLDATTSGLTTFATGIDEPVDVRVADDGSVYYLLRSAGAVYRVQYGASAPGITSHPASQTVAPGVSVTFSVRASGAAPLRYQWQRNGIDISGATAQDYTIPSASASDNGVRFRASVTNDFGSVLSNEAILTVSANQPPTGTISQPTTGALYRGGSVVAYAGSATDSEDGTLTASAFTWWVDFHHDTHTHPFMPPTSGTKSGSFTIPTVGETSANVWYRIYLAVRDSAGLSHTTFRDILPQKVRLTFATNPAGLALRLDGQPVVTPLTIDAVVGIDRTIDAPTPQTAGSTNYAFVSWSDSGAATHPISTPAADTTYTATYQASGPIASIRFVQQIGRDAGTTASATLAFPSPNTLGNLVAVVVRASGLGKVFTISDSTGNQYRPAVQFNATLDGVSFAIFYAENIKGGPNTVTVSTSQSGTLRFALLEYAGVATVNALDVTSVAQGSGTSPSSGSLQTSVNGALLVGGIMTANSSTVTAGVGYTVRTSVPSSSSAKLVVEDRVQAAAGGATATASLAAADTWAVGLAAFRPGGTSQPPGAPTSPTPADAASGVSTAASLSWSAGGATSYDVYFGSTTTPPLVASGLGASSYAPTAMIANTRYYWRVVARNAVGSTAGPVWTFTTAAPPSSGPIALVQQAGRDAGTTSSATLAFPSVNTAGNLIVVCVRASGLGQAFTLSDSNGNVYRRATQFNVTLDGVTLGIFYAENIRGGSNTVSVANSQSGTLRFGIMEYTGVATSNALDVTATAEGTGTTANSGLAQTTVNGALLVGAIMTANASSVAPSGGYTVRTSVPNSAGAKLVVEDRVQPTAGPASASATLAASDTWGVALAAFRAAGM